MKYYTASEIKKLRESLGLSKIKFATAIGLSSYKQVTLIEEGKGAITPQTQLILNYIAITGVKFSLENQMENQTED